MQLKSSYPETPVVKAGRSQANPEFQPPLWHAGSRPAHSRDQYASASAKSPGFSPRFLTGWQSGWRSAAKDQPSLRSPQTSSGEGSDMTANSDVFPSVYIEAALQNECRTVSGTPAGKGLRNRLLNSAAFNLGRLVPGDWMKRLP